MAERKTELGFLSALVDVFGTLILERGALDGLSWEYLHLLPHLHVPVLIKSKHVLVELILLLFILTNFKSLMPYKVKICDIS